MGGLEDGKTLCLLMDLLIHMSVDSFIILYFLEQKHLR